MDALIAQVNKLTHQVLLRRKIDSLLQKPANTMECRAYQGLEPTPSFYHSPAYLQGFRQPLESQQPPPYYQPPHYQQPPPILHSHQESYQFPHYQSSYQTPYFQQQFPHFQEPYQRFQSQATTYQEPPVENSSMPNDNYEEFEELKAMVMQVVAMQENQNEEISRLIAYQQLLSERLGQLMANQEGPRDGLGKLDVDDGSLVEGRESLGDEPAYDLLNTTPIGDMSWPSDEDEVEEGEEIILEFLRLISEDEVEVERESDPNEDAKSKSKKSFGKGDNLETVHALLVWYERLSDKETESLRSQNDDTLGRTKANDLVNPPGFLEVTRSCGTS